MCKCTPNIRTPFCGKPGCETPAQWNEAKSLSDIKVGTVWLHIKSGQLYIVIGITNAGNPYNDDNNPPIASYLAVEGNGTVYSREVSKFPQSFRRCPILPEKPDLDIVKLG